MWQTTAVALCVVTGTIFDPQHHPVASANIYLEQGAKNVVTGTTDSTGKFSLSAPCGSYTLRAEADPSTAPLTLEPSKPLTIDLTLQPPFFDEPTFTVAGVTDNTYRGGHGSDNVLRSAESLTKATASLANPGKDYEAPGHALEAVKEFQLRAESTPSEAGYFDWGTELLVHHAAEPAAEVFTKGVRLYPQSARMFLGLATAWYSAGDYDKAASYFFKATDLDPKDSGPYLFLGKIEARTIKESPGYQARMARFAELHPDNALANYYHAVSLNNSDSHVYLKKAISLDPHLGVAHLHLGILLANDGKYPEAIVAYQKALEVTPDLDEAHYRLAEAYRVTGQTDLAKKEMSTYQTNLQRSAERIEKERREVQRFVIDLKNQTHQ